MSAPEHSQFDLLRSRRLLPLFLTQFLGACNDNVFKNAFVIMLAVRTADSSLLVNLCAAIFVLPFFLFSATAGQIAERFEKARLIRIIKLAEIAIMAIGAYGFVSDSTPLLYVSLFSMGVHSTFFGPIKYSILPQHLRPEELVGGNGLVEMGTFIAILLGTIAGAVLISLPGGAGLAATAVLLLAILGWLASRAIPAAPAAAPALRINWNIATETLQIIGIARERRAVYLSILGCSWFWMLGAAYITQLPNYATTTLGGNEQVITLLLATFSVGVGLGSLLCERLSGHKVELGLVPFGSIGLSLFGIDLYFAANNVVDAGGLRGPLAFLLDPRDWRVLMDLLLLGTFGGFYIVPLYAIIQSRSAPDKRSRVLAANNILNALFMVAAAGLAVLLLRVAGLSIPHMFLVFAGLNALVAAYIYTLLPEFLMRFLVWLLTSTIYSIKRVDLDRIPDEGAAVVVCNHVSYVDALIIAGSCRRPIRFVVDAPIYRMPVLNFIFRTAGAIPIASQKREPETFENAFRRIAAYLRDGEVVCIFPEGMLTRDGNMNAFRAGIERIISENAVPVIPMALRGLWGSLFSYAETRFRQFPQNLRRSVELLCGEPMPAVLVNAADLESRVKALRGGWA
ncbi:MAG TPA: MFS transporter [Candidatus Cybelea sp.]|nr:MFS transporter [Candidatus Cybelea sp.]